MLRLVIWPSMMPLGWTETKLWTLKYGSESIQTSLISRKRPPKPYKLLKFFISFVATVKSCHAPSIWKKMRWKALCLLILNKIIENVDCMFSEKSGKTAECNCGVCSNCGPIYSFSRPQSVHYSLYKIADRKEKLTDWPGLVNLRTIMILIDYICLDTSAFIWISYK